MERRVASFWIGAALQALAFLWAAPALAQDVTLTETLTRADHETYRELPFTVPDGVTRLTVEFAYTGKDQRTTVDLGLYDPARFRGWSGGNKAGFTLAETDATPSYLPGPIVPGTWRLVLGVPNIREGTTATYTAKITFGRTPAFNGFSVVPLATGPKWWRGDLHMHTGHSDGSCLSAKGAKVPCPVFKTLETAQARHLDFVAVTDHNATAQTQALRELQPYFDDLLLIPARELTTFKGHANIFGPVGPIDFQLGSPRAPTLAKIMDEVDAAHGLLSINHPGLPSGEACMGCGWIAETDWSRVTAMEVVNGGLLAQTGDAAGPFSAIPIWEAKLNAGHRITAIGGSDNHDGTATGKTSVGVPTTVVYAQDLSQPAILDAIRKGHAFIDVYGIGGRLEVTAKARKATAMMGDALAAPKGAVVEIAVTTDSGVVTFAGDVPIPSARFLSDGKPHWIRADVRGPDGKLRLIGNPIYLNH